MAWDGRRKELPPPGPVRFILEENVKIVKCRVRHTWCIACALLPSITHHPLFSPSRLKAKKHLAFRARVTISYTNFWTGCFLVIFHSLHFISHLCEFIAFNWICVREAPLPGDIRHIRMLSDVLERCWQGNGERWGWFDHFGTLSAINIALIKFHDHLLHHHFPLHLSLLQGT